MRRVLTSLLLLLATAACGEHLPAVPRHGLTVEPLESDPTGAAVEIGASIGPGTWEADVRLRWTVVRDGGSPAKGRARVTLVWTIDRTSDEDLRARLGVRVSEQEGLAGSYVSDVNGIEVTWLLDAHGRARPDTLRFGAAAPPNARRFLDGLWLAGFGLGRPWVPPRPVRLGEAWTRPELGALGEMAMVTGADVPEPTSAGGGRLESLVVEDGETRAEVRLSSLTAVEGRLRLGMETAGLGVGVLSEGRAQLGLEDGVPRRWTYGERTRYLADDGITRQDIDLRQDVEGSVRRVR